MKSEFDEKLLLAQIKRHSYNSSKLVLSWVSIHKILAQLEKPFDAEAVAQRCADTAKPGSKYYGMSKDDILNQWAEKRTSGSNKGIGLDTYINSIFNAGIKLEILEPSLKNKCAQFDKFKLDVIDKHNIKFIGSEIWINSVKYGIRGRLDSLMLSNDNELIIFDWKNNEEFNINMFEKMLGPCCNLLKSDINKFTLQVYLYKFMLETEFDLKISGVRIVQFRENEYVIHKPAFKYDDDFMRNVIEYALNKIDEETKNAAIIPEVLFNNDPVPVTVETNKSTADKEDIFKILNIKIDKNVKDIEF